MAARPGNFCSPEGSAGTTTAGTPMVCSVRDGDRARWRSTGGTDQANAKADRRRLLRDAKRAGVTVPRGMPGDDVRRLIAEAAIAVRHPVAKPVDVRVLDAVRDGLKTDPHGFLSLAVVRYQLSDVPRDQVDAALVALDKVGSVVLDPQALRWRLTAADKWAALHFGGEDMHLVSLTPASRGD
jgi:hypothetical protein